MTSYAFGNFEFGIDLANLIDEATQVHSDIGGFRHLGKSTTDQNKRMAEIINRAILAFMRACPGIGISYRSTITTVANQGGYAIPDDMQGMAIGYVQWQNSGLDPANDNRFLRYLNVGQVINLSNLWANGRVTSPFPSYWSISNFAANKTLLTGAVEVANGSADVDGTDTDFENELAAGDVIQVYGQNLTVGSITGDDSLILTAAWDGEDYSGMPYYLLDGTAFSNINLWPFPGSDGNIANVIYQTAPVAITATNIANREIAPTMINEIPTEYQNVVAMNVAINILTQDNMFERKQFLMNIYPQILRDAQDRMGAPEAADNPLAVAGGGVGSMTTDQTIFGGMFDFGINGGNWQ